MPISTAIATAATRRRSVWRSRALLSTWTCASDGIGTEAAAARTSATTAAASRPLMSATTSTLRMTWSCTMVRLRSDTEPGDVTEADLFPGGCRP